MLLNLFTRWHDFKTRKQNRFNKIPMKGSVVFFIEMEKQS